MTANALQPRRLDFSKISNRIVGNISTEEALKDVTCEEKPCIQR